MPRRMAFGILMSAVIAWAAPARSADGDYAGLSAADKRVVDALYSAQRPIAGSPALTRDDLVSLRSEDGWGRVFRDLKDGGYYSNAENLGRVVSRARRHRRIAARSTDHGARNGTAQRHRGAVLTDKTTKRTVVRAKPRRARRVTTRQTVRLARRHRVARGLWVRRRGLDRVMVYDGQRIRRLTYKAP